MRRVAIAEITDGTQRVFFRSTMSLEELTSLLNALRVPGRFKPTNFTEIPLDIAWNAELRNVLRRLQDTRLYAGPGQLARVAAAVSQLDGDDYWIQKETREAAHSSSPYMRYCCTKLMMDKRSWTVFR